MKPTAELITLVDKCLARKLSRVEMAELEQLLENDDNLRYYLEVTEVEGNLPYALEAGVTLAPPKERSNIIKSFIRPLSIAAAAAVTFYAGYFTASRPQDDASIAAGQDTPQHSENAAAITSLVGVRWENTPPDSIQLSKESEALAFTSGVVELSFSSGVRSLVEGPAVVRITGDNSAILERGRMVSDVPKGAEGFTIEYPEGKVVDLGTEFAIHVPQNQLGAEVGVFRGEVEIYDHKQNTPLRILENHAVVQISGARNPFASIPFHRDQFIRELPSSEYPWKLSEHRTTEPEILTFDVSHLVWRPGAYRSIVKYMQGIDVLQIYKAELFLDGQLVSSDSHAGSTGNFLNTTENTYTFHVPEEIHKKGKWTIQLTAGPRARGGLKPGHFTPDSSGIMLFEASSPSSSKDEAFVGIWEYRHNGDIHRRVFTADHKAKYYFNGQETTIFDAATWEVQDGILILTIPPSNAEDPPTHKEQHLLKDEEELIFVNRPYRNALKVK